MARLGWACVSGKMSLLCVKIKLVVNKKIKLVVNTLVVKLVNLVNKLVVNK